MFNLWGKFKEKRIIGVGLACYFIYFYVFVRNFIREDSLFTAFIELVLLNSCFT